MSLYTEGLDLVLDPTVLAVLVLSVLGGVVIGTFPGLSATMAVAVAVPLTFGLDPTISFALLLGVFCGSVYGGAIPAIVANIPGTPTAIMTSIDGHPLTKKGDASKALNIAVVSSVLGGLVGVIALGLFAPPIAGLALNFGPREYFAVALLGLSIISYISDASMVKSMISGVLGLMLATIGADPITGGMRFAFGQNQLISGLDLVPVLIGVFGLAVVFENVSGGGTGKSIDPPKQLGGSLLKVKELLRLAPTIGRSSAIGTFVGAIPAAGGTIATIIGYGVEKRISPNRANFGKGAHEGVAAPEAANNSAVGGSMIPMMTLGIPGDAVTAILIGALIMNGLNPGPMLFVDHSEFVSSIFLMLLIANVVFLVIGLLGARYIAKVLAVPGSVLMPLIAILCCVGAYAINRSMFDVGILLLFGVVGYLFKLVRIPASPLVLGLVLGIIVESNARRVLASSGGDASQFLSSPISLGLLAATAVVLLGPVIGAGVKRLVRRRASSA